MQMQSDLRVLRLHVTSRGKYIDTLASTSSLAPKCPVLIDHTCKQDEDVPLAHLSSAAGEAAKTAAAPPDHKAPGQSKAGSSCVALYQHTTNS